MSKTTNALLFKFLMTLVVTGIAFGFIGGNAFKWILLVAVLGTVIDYLAGDLLILPKVGSFISALINGVLAALIALAVAMIVPAFTTTTFYTDFCGSCCGGRVFLPSVPAKSR